MENPCETGSFWDHIEAGLGKRKEYRKVGEGRDAFHIRINQCPDCDLIWVCETFNQGDEYMEDNNWYGVKETATVKSILKSYDI